MFVYKKDFLKAIYLILKSFINLKEKYKFSFLLVLDSFNILFSLIIIKSIFGNEEIVSIYFWDFIKMISCIIFSIIIFYFSGQYNSLSKYIASSELFIISSRNLLILPIFYSFRFFFKLSNSPLKIYFLFWIINSFLMTFSRFFLKEANDFFEKLNSKKMNRVAIYGAGAAGAQLAATLSMTGNYKILAFFDDNPNLHRRKLYGTPIFSPSKISRFKGEISQILFAIPSLNKDESIKIIKKVQDYEIPILKVPSIEALTKGDAKIDSLRPIEIEDLLGRGAVEPRTKLLEDSINNQNICITGAGGSIGTELCKQALNYKPKSLIMIDSSESNLYHLEELISKINPQRENLKIISILGCVKDYSFVLDVFLKYKVEIVYHAAAYKHVPLIEKNPLSGIDNNVFSTLSICRASEKTNVKKVILVSTDKAVRPSNIMGASKRLGELILQAFMHKNNSINPVKSNISVEIKPKFSIVRFGNVLNSSGSVVPLFKKQIASGGPLTLTHREVIRYFMTVPEAAQLVIQATALSEGGEVFLLDMGSPVKIIDLARQMIRLSGFSVKDDNSPNGDIEILITGLRPGEKLYEELLIDAECKKTKHPLIFKANESFLEYDFLIEKITRLKKYIENKEKENVLKLLSELVPEWKNKNTI